MPLTCIFLWGVGSDKETGNGTGIKNRRLNFPGKKRNWNRRVPVERSREDTWNRPLQWHTTKEGGNLSDPVCHNLSQPINRGGTIQRQFSCTSRKFHMTPHGYFKSRKTKSLKSHFEEGRVVCLFNATTPRRSLCSLIWNKVAVVSWYRSLGYTTIGQEQLILQSSS